jgi:flavin reductase (DIM6/NTAB) family NADH-FMN oxidoreductase RutF
VPLEAGSPAEDGRAFRRCLGQFATGVTVVTARNGDKLAGLAVNSFAAVSLSPALVLWSIRRESGSAPDFLQASHFAVSVLADDQVQVSQMFGSSHPQRFELTAWRPGLGGAPLLAGAIAQFECRRAMVHEGGDHLILIGEVERYARFEGAPLLFAQGRYGVAQEHPSLDEGVAAAPAPAAPPEASHELLRNLIYASQRLSLGFDLHRQALGLAVPTARVINRLSEGPCQAQALVQSTFLGPEDVADALSSLVRQGLAQTDAAGVATLSTAGRERHELLAQRAADYMADEFRGIDASDLAAFQRVLLELGRR